MTPEQFNVEEDKVNLVIETLKRTIQIEFQECELPNFEELRPARSFDNQIGKVLYYYDPENKFHFWIPIKSALHENWNPEGENVLSGPNGIRLKAFVRKEL